MNVKVYPKEVIYIANVHSKENPKGERFAVHHTFVKNKNDGGIDSLNYNISRERLMGYIHGATASPKDHVIEMVNGIPTSIRKDFFPTLDIKPLSIKDFNHFNHIFKEASIR